MLSNDTQTTLGVILCKHCHCTIDTVDTEKVMIYYIECETKECIAKRENSGRRNDKY
jgi:hypothetical protein